MQQGQCCTVRLGLACALAALGTIHTVVAQAVITVQLHEREPWPCFQSDSTFRRKVVPLPALVEPKLWHIAVLVNAKGQVIQ